MTITTETEYQAAQQPMAELAGCLEDPPEQHELIKLELAAAVWESKQRAG
ncbi:MAG TPA: hypothetical protein VGN82_14105 [Bosea sp. (in: a-proteobacteria)]|jgi:hypothetical protein|nr:hypothetical protein [Bosea sp. (in: a-proteobacteria)]